MSKHAGFIMGEGKERIDVKIARNISSNDHKCKKCGALCNKREAVSHLQKVHGMRVTKKWWEHFD
jgi:hypothetical protein